MSWRYLHGGGRANIPSEDELKGLCPAAFNAATLNSYSWFSFNPVTRNVTSEIVVWHAAAHLSLPFSLFSSIYPVIGLPPSSLGLFQERVIESIVVSTAYGDPGAEGGSKWER